MKPLTLRRAEVVPALLVGVILAAGSTHDARADATATADGAITFSVSSPTSGVTVVWSADSSDWILSAEAHLDHSDSSPKSLTDTQFVGPGGSANVGPDSILDYASIDDATAHALSGGASLSVTGLKSFAHSLPPSVAFADGIVIADNLFHFAANGLDPLPEMADLLLTMSGGVSLHGESTLPGDWWRSEYSILVDVYDPFSVEADPIIASYAFGDHLEGSGNNSVDYTSFIIPTFELPTTTLDDSPLPIVYALRVTLDLETRAVAVPAPSALALAAIGLPLLGVGSWLKRRLAPRPVHP